MKDQHRLFATFAISYLVVLAIAAVVTLVGYQRTLSVSQRKVHEQVERQLDSRVALLESQLKEVENRTSTLSLNAGVSRLLRLDRDYPLSAIMLIKDTFSSLSALNLTDSFVFEYLVLFERPQLLLSTRRIALDPARYYEGFLRYEGSSFADWVAQSAGAGRAVSFRPAAGIYHEPDAVLPTRVVTMIQRIPAARRSQYSGVIYALIDERMLLEYLDIPAFEGFDGWSAVFMRDGTPLATEGIDPARAARLYTDTTIDDEYVVRVVSPNTGWTYMTRVPPHYLAAETRMVRDLLLYSELAILILGLGAAFLLARMQSRPFATIVRTLRHDESRGPRHGGFLGSLAAELTGVIEDHRALETELVRIRPQLRRSVLERLIFGRFAGEESLRETMAQAGLDFSDVSYRIYLFALEYPSYDQARDRNAHVLISSLVGKTLGRIWENDGLVIEIDAGRLALVVRASGATPSRLQAMFGALETAERAVARIPEASLTCGESRHFRRLIDASLYYDELARAIEHNQFHDRLKFVRAEELGPLEDYCFYPLSQEQRLVNLTKSGDVEEVEALIRTILDHNCHTLRLSSNGILQLKHEMIGTIHKVWRSQEGMGIRSAQADLGQLVHVCEEAGSGEALAAALIRVYDHLCIAAREGRQDAPSTLVSEAKAVVDRNYSDTQICLQSVADDLSVSPKYLSRSFSRVDGSTFSEYLEHVRMESALELLARPDDSASDVAERVGYTSANTFFKAFKRRYGVTPSEWRFQNGSASTRRASGG